jgi:hypothetical protein
MWSAGSRAWPPRRGLLFSTGGAAIKDGAHRLQVAGFAPRRRLACLLLPERAAAGGDLSRPSPMPDLSARRRHQLTSAAAIFLQ